MKGVQVGVCILLLCMTPTWCYRSSLPGTGARHQRSHRVAMTTNPIEETKSQRLQKAKLRLAEVQGVIPIGASENPDTAMEFMTNKPSLSKVREISWRVAEPAVKYDPISASEKFFAEPISWIVRNVQFLIPMSLFFANLVRDILSGREKQNRKDRAEQLLTILTRQSPAIIKAGQALASRSDLLPKDYLDSLQKLQDRCPAYPTEQAVALFYEEIGKNFEDVYELESDEPVAAASIGQVYKGRLKSNGAQVAIKIQRPGCEESIAVDMFILRWYCQLAQRILKLANRDIDLVSVIDDFGEIIYREIDYRAEAVNAQRFAELYSTIPDVFVPKVYTDLSTSKVLTMEWVDGARLNDQNALDSMGLDATKFVDTLVQCSLRQMLENGFFHADPHAGNLLAMPSGKLCYLDFGMVSYVEAPQRLNIIEAVVHIVNRDFDALTGLYKRMGFIPKEVDPAPIVNALEDVLPDVLNAPVKELNFKTVISKLGDIMFKFPFSLPPFYIAIIRCLGVLEGLAIQVDDEFRIIDDAYPYIASRLLTDPSEELQDALRQLLFKDNRPNYERLLELLERASDTSDYDVSMAIDQLMGYLLQPQARDIREELTMRLADIIDELGADALDFTTQLLRSPTSRSPVQSLRRLVGTLRQSRTQGVPAIANLVTQASIESNVQPTESLQNAAKLVSLIGKQGRNNTMYESDSYEYATTPTPVAADANINYEKVVAVLRKVLREPAAQEMIATVVSEVSDRAAARLVNRMLRQ